MTPTSPYCLEAKKLTKSYNHPANIQILKGINLSIKPGESVAIVGRSGEGKSTLLQILGSLEIPCEGELFIAGEKIHRLNQSRLRNEKIGFVFQSFHLLDDYSVMDNVLMPARIGRKPIHSKSESYQRSLSLLEAVGLKERIKYPVKLLSGGEKQRVALARALCNDPPLILADEPSGNLDRKTAEVIHTFLLDLVKNENKALLIVTHDRELADLCTTTYELSEGILKVIKSKH